MITLYSTNCPKCIILEKKLQNAGIEFTKESDLNKIIALGFSSAPILQVDNNYYEFNEAVALINKRK